MKKNKISEKLGIRVLCAVELAVGVLAAVNCRAEGLGEATPRAVWTLTPEAKALVARLAESAKAYAPVSPRPQMFSRAQLKYGAHRPDFIHNWYDRPLHQDSSWNIGLKHGQLLQPDAWLKTAETVRLSKLDGLAVCIAQSGRSEVIAQSVRPGGETSVLVELPYAGYDKGLPTYLDTAARALAMPNAFRLNGKVVLTRYPAVKEDALPFVGRLRAALDEKFGPGKFAVMFYVSPFEERLGSAPLNVANIESMREHLRRCLRAMDGIFLTGSPAIHPRRYQPAFERDVLLPIYQSVLAEPEFAGKKVFGIQIAGGHENCYRWSYSIDSEGTRQLCERLETVRRLRPDFVICTEWDEENENTFFRPTVANGFTTQRILRYYADRFANRAPEIFPGDDTSVPNLIVSYRRSLIAGEPVEVEVRNIPDGTFAGETFELRFQWRDAAGEKLVAYPAQTLAADTPGAVRFVSPASDLAGARIVRPLFGVRTKDGRIWRFGADFWPLDVGAVRALDTKWAKHALRERVRGITGALSVGEPDAAGVRRVEGRFDSQVPVRSVEVLEGPDTVYMYDAEKPAAAPEGSVRIKVAIQARASTPQKYALNGTIRLTGAANGVAEPTDLRNAQAIPGGWALRNVRNSNWSQCFFFTVPSNEVATAEIAVALAPNYATTLKVREIVAKESIGVTGPAGGNLVATHLLGTTMFIPKPVGRNAGTFAFDWRPASPTAVVRLQVVDADYHVWRGAFSTIFRPAGETRQVTVRERDTGEIRTLTLDRNLVLEPTFDFGDSRGSVIGSREGRAFSGILGGAATLVTGYGRGESCYGDTLTRYLTEGEFDHVTAPSHVQDGDRAALAFDGHQYAMLPLQVVPKFAGFEVACDVKADDLAGIQPVADAGNAAWGVALREGVPTAYIFDTENYARDRSSQHVATGPRLTPGVWHRLVVSYDCRELVVSVDGVRGQPVPASGYQMQTRYLALGAANRQSNFLRGRLANLSVRIR